MSSYIGPPLCSDISSNVIVVRIAGSTQDGISFSTATLYASSKMGLGGSRVQISFHRLSASSEPCLVIGTSAQTSSPSKIGLFSYMLALII